MGVCEFERKRIEREKLYESCFGTKADQITKCIVHGQHRYIYFRDLKVLQRIINISRFFAVQRICSF